MNLKFNQEEIEKAETDFSNVRMDAHINMALDKWRKYIYNLLISQGAP
ncbi:MAG: hypothetical protein BAJALOKI3v1_1100006 [Promethearchaeota archaeon]|nr:MAG: hypothetical protein BAJALOKI3v1_1100006 [Candidatus Lokiarchaeota archaeon]